MKKNTTKRALWMSVLSLFLCFSMLVGTTFAWFTDEVKSDLNKIVAGNLDVNLYHADKGTNNELTVVNGETKLFDDLKLWEPGAVVYETLQVTNEGTLALKYNLILNVLEETVVNGAKLSDVIMVGLIDGALGAGTTREGLIAAVTEWTALNAFTMKQNAVQLLPEAEKTVTVVLYWQPNSAEVDNQYNVKDEALNLKIGVTLVATQLANENDSFGNGYDADVKVPTASNISSITANSDGSATMTVMDAPSADSKRTVVDAPAGAFAAGAQVELEVDTVNSLFNVTAAGGVVASLDVTLTVDGQETSGDLDSGAYTVTTYISKGLTNVTVAYVGNGAQPTDVTYDAETGKLTFKTTHFSEYAVSGAALAFDVVSDVAVNDVVEIVEAAKDEDSTLVIPEENKQVVVEIIEEAVADGTITEADAAVANTLVYVAQIGDVTYAVLADALAALKSGETLVLLNNVTANITIVQQADVVLTIDGKGNTLNGVITVDGKSGTYTTAGLTIKNLIFKADSISADACINLGDGTSATRYTCNVTVENCTFDVPGAVGVKSYTGGDKNVTITGCTATANAHSLCQLKGVDGVLVEKCTVKSKNGMNFNNSDNVVVDSCVVNVKGYTVRFGESSGGSGAAETYLIKDSTLTTDDSEGDAAVILRGTADNATLTITNTTINGATKIANTAKGTKIHLDEDVAAVYDGDSLKAALADGKDVLFLNNITMAATESNAYGKTGINVKNGQTIDGNGFTLKVTGAGGTWDSAISTTGGTIKNLTVAQGFRGIFVNHNSAHSETVVLDTVTIQGPTYTISCDQGMNQDLVATNCTINGWTSYAKTIGTVKFEDCSFGYGAGYKFCRPYAPTEFVACTFTEGYAIDKSNATVTFTDCTAPN